MVLDPLQKRRSHGANSFRLELGGQGAGKAEAVAEHNRTGFHARDFVNQRHDTFRVEFLVRIERDLKRGAQRTIGAFLLGSRRLLGAGLFAYVCKFRLRRLGNWMLRLRHRRLGHRGRRDIEALRVFLRLRGKWRGEILTGILFFLVVPHPQRSGRQILQHFLQRQRNIHRAGPCLEQATETDRQTHLENFRGHTHAS